MHYTSPPSLFPSPGAAGLFSLRPVAQPQHRIRRAGASTRVQAFHPPRPAASDRCALHLARCVLRLACLCAQVPVTSSRQVTVKRNVTRTEFKTVTENRTMQVNETVTEVSFETVSVTVNATSARPADALMLLDASSSMLCYSCSGGKCAPLPRPRLRRDSPHIRAAPGRSHVYVCSGPCLGAGTRTGTWRRKRP